MLGVQDSLFATGDLAVQRDAAVHRTWLDSETWVDHTVGFLTGQLDLYERLAAMDIWHRGWRPMYGAMVPEPRLSAGVAITDRALPAVVTELHAVVAERYGTTSAQTWLNWYRDGSDAVAWHSDRIGRNERNPAVAIVSLGSTRRFMMRPKGGGPSTNFTPAGGDLLVMGGASQHRFDHCVPRARNGGPRISVTFRPGPGGTADQASGRVDSWAPGRVRRSA